MAETRKYTRAGRRTIINANNIIGKVGDKVFICTSLAAMEICRKLIRERGLWRTTYATQYNDNDYVLPDDDEFAVISQIVEDFLGDTTDMSCNDLVNELNDIEQAINALAGGCGCGSGGEGGTSPPESTEDTGDITSDTGTAPEGYDNWQQYQEAKCNIAYWIVNNFIADLSWLSIFYLTGGSITASALALGLLTALSGGTIIVLVTAILALTVLGSDLLGDLKDAIEADKDDIVCAILTGDTAGESIANFRSAVDTAIDAGIASALPNYAAKQVAYQFADTTQFNLLTAPKAEYDGRPIPGGQDCADCGISCHNINIEYGEYLGNDLYRLSFALGKWRCQGNWNSDNDNNPPDTCGPEEYVTITDVTGYTHSGEAENDFRLWEDGAPLSSIYDSDTPPVDTQFCARRFALTAGASYDCTIERGGFC